MDEAQVQKQLDNMKQFIIQEAEEKKEEIKQKTKEEFSIEKSNIFQAGRLKIIKEYERKEKQIEITKKIEYSNSLNQARLRELKAREIIIERLRDESKKRLNTISRPGAEYQDLLKKLIIQCLLKLREREVAIRCRAEDLSMVEAVMSAARDEYTQKTGLPVVLSIDKQNSLPSAPTKDLAELSEKQYCFGGVVLGANQGRILCNNTLDQRLGLTFDATIPQMRAMLFPSTDAY